jgi:hypothetical protein
MSLRKTLALALVALFGVALAGPALADQNKPMGDDVKMGTVTKVDPAGKMMVVTATPKGATATDARQWTVYWDETTKMEGGSIREGEMVHFRASERDGKTVATWLHVGKMDGSERK